MPVIALTTGLTLLGVLSPSTDISASNVDNFPDPTPIIDAETLSSITGDGGLPLDGNYILLNDIDLSTYSRYPGWTPIGTAGAEFTGTFDGRGYKITGLNINDPNPVTPIGLFGVVGEGGTIKNLGLVGSNVTVSGEHSHYTGALVGWLFGTIENCYSTGTVSGVNDVGGLVGVLEPTGKILNSYNTGTVSGVENVGGLVGSLVSGLVDGLVTTGELLNSYNTGTVSGTLNVGGVAGENAGTIKNCYNTGRVTGKVHSEIMVSGIGGVVGNNFGKIISCFNTGSVIGEVHNSGNQVSGIGGVAGVNYMATIENCYNTGRVSGTGDSIGGVVGHSRSNSMVQNCYNIGNVSGRNFVGGIIGSHANADKTQNTVSLGLTVSQTGSNIGRILGGVFDQNTNDGPPILSNNKARSDMLIGIAGSLAVPTTDIGANLKNGASITPGTATMASVFASAEGWDSEIWNIPTGNLVIHGALPTLKNMPGRTQNPILPPYLVTVTGGRLQGGGTEGSFDVDATVNITATAPAAGYVFSGWNINPSVIFLNNTSYKSNNIEFIMPSSNVTVTAVFTALPPGNNLIAVTHSGNGVANANAQSSLPGETITLTAFPDPGYRFLAWEILSDGNVALSSETAMTATFVMPNYAVSFNAVFEAIPNNIVDSNPQSFGTWTGNGDASATINAPFNSFIQLSLDGKVVDSSNYSVKSGSTIITLYESYIETFDYGEYTFRAEFNDGFAYLTLIIYEEVPRTGDVSILLWLVLIIISGIGVAVALRCKERGSA
jgi:hypothetical protein